MECASLCRVAAPDAQNLALLCRKANASAWSNACMLSEARAELCLARSVTLTLVSVTPTACTLDMLNNMGGLLRAGSFWQCYVLYYIIWICSTNLRCLCVCHLPLLWVLRSVRAAMPDILPLTLSKSPRTSRFFAFFLENAVPHHQSVSRC